MGPKIHSLLEPLVGQIIAVYQQHPHSCFLYLGELRVAINLLGNGHELFCEQKIKCRHCCCSSGVNIFCVFWSCIAGRAWCLETKTAWRLAVAYPGFRQGGGSRKKIWRPFFFFRSPFQKFVHHSKKIMGEKRVGVLNLLQISQKSRKTAKIESGDQKSRKQCVKIDSGDLSPEIFCKMCSKIPQIWAFWGPKRGGGRFHRFQIPKGGGGLEPPEPPPPPWIRPWSPVRSLQLWGVWKIHHFLLAPPL